MTSPSKPSSSLHRSLSGHLSRLQLRKDDDNGEHREDKKTLRKPSHKSSPPLPRKITTDPETGTPTLTTSSTLSSTTASSSTNDPTPQTIIPVSPSVSKSSAGSFLSRTLSSKRTRANSSSKTRPSPPPPSSTSSPLLSRSSDPLKSQLDDALDNAANRSSSKSDDSSGSNSSPPSHNHLPSSKARDRNTLKDVFGKFVGSFNGK
ncbi:hypothetical protein BCR42DRAFT_30152 [Absidia repens]|uniref:Uncharacterized protein n=1 Tax=Absidia repens TaxID=90262 RepID=A0A1X2IJ07_9FUNG|nr:hypothetical protein BCR42DRAFT_30152 [Absidia repens]